MLCAGFSLCCVRDLVCVMCGIQSVLYGGFNLCDVRDLDGIMRGIRCMLYPFFGPFWMDGLVRADDRGVLAAGTPPNAALKLCSH